MKLYHWRHPNLKGVGTTSAHSLDEAVANIRQHIRKHNRSTHRLVVYEPTAVAGRVE